ncbi:leader peptidase (prepilin peptidase) / N-methyltransferase [Agrococcus baldri]|uniref:Leader peptidase (Prepilin peptidase) / N-methyltransferase n=1 Tax=Agrococcus baldri TaxID=153730 RepID=A0AA94HK29_9MICO|nr:prepilin peptidase [Agrococcus baldri]SFR98475.1 leader peptidase (prepilin peptidase) / N-methyltransferase [Agrococcus baldri]
MPPLMIATAAALCAAAAVLLTPWARGIVDSSSKWLHRWVPGVLGTIFGAGAALLAGHWAVLLALCVLAIGCALLIAVDLAVFRLPDMIVWPTTGLVLVLLLLAAIVTGEWGRFWTAVLAMLAVGAGYFIFAFISPASLGLGDVKLSLVLGLALGWFGWQAVFFGILGGFIVLALVAFALMAVRRASIKSDLAFGPWMIVGAAAGLAVATVGA